MEGGVRTVHKVLHLMGEKEKEKEGKKDKENRLGITKYVAFYIKPKD